MPVTHLASAAVARALTARHREAAIAHTPGLDNTRLFMSLTAGAGTRSKVFSLHYQAYRRITGHKKDAGTLC